MNHNSLCFGRIIDVVTFSLKEMILRMVLNKSLFTSSNLLFDPDNPYSDPPKSIHIGEVNTGTWMKDTQAR